MAQTGSIPVRLIFAIGGTLSDLVAGALESLVTNADGTTSL